MSTQKKSVYIYGASHKKGNMMCRFGTMMKYHVDISPSNWLHLTFMPDGVQSRARKEKKSGSILTSQQQNTRYDIFVNAQTRISLLYHSDK